MDSLSNALPPSAQAAAMTGSYLDFDGLSKLKGQARTDSKAATRETAQQFEAMFLQMMMKSMRDATPKSELNESSATETFEAMFDKEVSVAMSKRNALGLADMLVKHMPDGSSAHLYCGPVVGAANIQLATCSPNFLIQESILDWKGFHTEILKKPIQWENGYIIPPTAPGLGVELNEEVALANPYTGTALHLDMTHHPILP